MPEPRIAIMISFVREVEFHENPSEQILTLFAKFIRLNNSGME